MNIDELKDAWNQDEPKGIKLQLDVALKSKTFSAVGIIRKNMKTEFIAVLISYTIFVALMFYGLQSPLFLNLASIFMFIIIVLNGFYFFRFYIFYKSISRYDLNVINGIRKITYELELNTEIYKTYNLCVAPLAVLLSFILLLGNIKIGFMKYILTLGVFNAPWSLLISAAIILSSFVITYVCVNFHIKSQYGKYLSELKQVMYDLGEDI